MPSMMAWLDHSAEEQRRVREIIRLFADTESRDELGIGQIRDVHSNRLFPGSSVVQTRVRYLLFIPWLFQIHEAKGRSGADLLTRTQSSERRLITTLKASQATGGDGVDFEGLIGGRAGAGVKVLPSAIYWPALIRYGILTRDVGPAELTSRRPLRGLDAEATDERPERPVTNWHPTLPDPPTGFPDVVPSGFRLRRDEATWLREVILQAAPGSLLAHLAARAAMPADDTFGPWEEPVAMSAAPDVVAVLEQARLFSLVIHGAALLYNLLLAEAYSSAGHTRAGDDLDEWYRDELADWAHELEADRPGLADWDLTAWWPDVLSENPRIGPTTRYFVTAWVDLVRSGPAARLADHSPARDLISGRERSQKKAQARLTNDRLLGNWNGASGAARLSYRWPTVHRLLVDLVTGLEDADAAA